MDPLFDKIFQKPENQIFQVVFYPDRIYHAQYLNATRSPRYNYNVQEVRSQVDTTVLKGQVFLDGVLLTNFLRIEYRAGRLTEVVREKGRFIKDRLVATVKLIPQNGPEVQQDVKLRYCPWIDAFQVELWETLEPFADGRHDHQVLDQIGRDGSITRRREFAPALRDLKALRHVEVSYRENELDLPFGYRNDHPEVDNNFGRGHQEPNSPVPSDNAANTVDDKCYLIDFQRGYYLQSQDVKPVRYRNAMMNEENPERFQENVIEMRWILQREFGSNVVFFHEVTVPAGTIEGTHQHIGTEELYYITEGEGTAFMAVGDDPKTDAFPTVTRNIYGLYDKPCKALPVKPGSVIFTKSGGIHGIRNDGEKPLKFVAFLYHSA